MAKPEWTCPTCGRADYAPTFDRYCCVEHQLVAPFHHCQSETCEFCNAPQSDEAVLADALRAQERHR